MSHIVQNIIAIKCINLFSASHHIIYPHVGWVFIYLFLWRRLAAACWVIMNLSLHDIKSVASFLVKSLFCQWFVTGRIYFHLRSFKGAIWFIKFDYLHKSVCIHPFLPAEKILYKWEDYRLDKLSCCGFSLRILRFWRRFDFLDRFVCDEGWRKLLAFTSYKNQFSTKRSSNF